MARFRYTTLAIRHSDDDWRIAVHESGHAIVGARYDCVFEHVEIGPKEHGEVVWISSPLGSSDQEFSPEDLLKWQANYAAGAAAEQIVFGEIRSYAIQGDVECHARINKLHKGETVDLFEDAIERALKDLSAEELCRVATSLIQQHKLDYDGVCGLIGVVPPYCR